MNETTNDCINEVTNNILKYLIVLSQKIGAEGSQESSIYIYLFSLTSFVLGFSLLHADINRSSRC